MRECFLGNCFPIVPQEGSVKWVSLSLASFGKHFSVCLAHVSFRTKSSQEPHIPWPPIRSCYSVKWLEDAIAVTCRCDNNTYVHVEHKRWGSWPFSFIPKEGMQHENTTPLDIITLNLYCLHFCFSRYCMCPFWTDFIKTTNTLGNSLSSPICSTWWGHAFPVYPHFS